MIFHQLGCCHCRRSPFLISIEQLPGSGRTTPLQPRLRRLSQMWAFACGLLRALLAWVPIPAVLNLSPRVPSKPVGSPVHIVLWYTVCFFQIVGAVSRCTK